MSWNPLNEDRYPVGSIVYNVSPLRTDSGQYSVDSKLIVVAHSAAHGYTVRAANEACEVAVNVPNRFLISHDERERYILSLSSEAEKSSRTFLARAFFTLSMSFMLCLTFISIHRDVAEVLMVGSVIIAVIAALLYFFTCDSEKEYPQDISLWRAHDKELVDLEGVLSYKTRQSLWDIFWE